MQHEIKQIFLLERLLELFHKDTIDSYRVRIHNTNSLLKELKQLLIGWEEKRVQNFETVKYCAEELLSCLKADNFICLADYNKDLFQSDLLHLTKSDGNKYDVYQLLYLLDKLIICNKDTYIRKIFDEIENYVFSENDFTEDEFIPVLDIINNLASKLATELINFGFSKNYIYIVLKSISKKSPVQFHDEFNLFRDLILSQNEIDFVVIFKLTSKKELTDVDFLVELVPEIKSEYLTNKVTERNTAFISPDNYSRFCCFEVKALDQFTAITKSKLKISELFDKIHLGYNGLEVNLHPTALVINLAVKNGARLNPIAYMLDGVYESNVELYSKFNELIQTIDENQDIAKDVKDRLFSALRYLRLGNNAIEIEQRFIDYWIGLEFIFSFPLKHQSTYPRLKENMVNILSCCYLKRNFMLLNNMLKKEGYIEDAFWTINDSDYDTMLTSISSTLLRYHIHKIKPIIYGHSDKRKEFITQHVNNLNQNISRIYHLRNELIHEAALKQNIENVTSSLRYYLLFVLNQLIKYFSELPNNQNEKKINIDDMLSEFKLWRKHIEKDWSLDVLLAVPIDIDLIERK